MLNTLAEFVRRAEFMLRSRGVKKMPRIVLVFEDRTDALVAEVVMRDDMVANSPHWRREFSTAAVPAMFEVYGVPVQLRTESDLHNRDLRL